VYVGIFLWQISLP